MATDDPGTPGDGHWEIALAADGTHTRRGWDIGVPEADINYGLGDRIQLNADIPWSYTNTQDGRWRSGLGETSFGVKWRFLDIDAFAMSTYPRYETSFSKYSERIGVASPHREFFLPFEVSAALGDFKIAADLGRRFVQHEPDFWQGGLVVAHSCGSERVECLAEVHREWTPGAAQTLLNFGLRWKLNDALTLLGAAGREFGSATDEQARAIVYLGLQISH